MTNCGGDRFSRCPLAATAFRAGHEAVIVRDSDKVAWYGYDKLNPVGYEQIVVRDDDRQHTLYLKPELMKLAKGKEIKGYEVG